MALSQEESVRFNASMDLISQIALQTQELLDIFRSGGVENPDWAVMKAELQTYASNASNLTTGMVPVARGGTGRSDGKVTDVYIPLYDKSAVQTGQIGVAIVKNAVDLDTIVEAGHYIISSPQTANHAPEPRNAIAFLDVDNQGNYIYQTLKYDNVVYHRFAARPNGIWEFTAWKLRYSYDNPNKAVYISPTKGLDTNFGSSPAYPLATWDAAIKKMAAEGAGATYSYTMYMEPGNYGDAAMYLPSVPATVYIRAWDSTNNVIYADDNAAHNVVFNTLTIKHLSNMLFSNVTVLGLLSIADTRNVHTEGYNRFSNITLDASYMNIAGNKLTWILSNAAEQDGHLVYALNHSDVNIGVDAIDYSAVSNKQIATMFYLRESSLALTKTPTITGTFTGTTISGEGFINLRAPSGKALETIQDFLGGTGVNTLYNFFAYNSSGYDCSLKRYMQHNMYANKHQYLERGNLPNNVEYGMMEQDKVDKFLGGILYSCSKVTDTTYKSKATLRIYDGSKTDVAYVDAFLAYEGTTVSFNAPHVLPTISGSFNLGSAGAKWNHVYAVDGQIQTSDEREKDVIGSIPDAVLDAWEEVQFEQFKFKKALEDKGAAARLHTGVIAQKIKNVFESKGLDATLYGLICYEEWEAKDETIVDEPAKVESVRVVDREAIYDADGIEVSPEISHMESREVEPAVTHVEHTDAGNQYFIRYDECLCMEAAFQRRRADRLEARIAAIEAKLG